MSFPAWLPAFNRQVTNRITGTFAGRVAPFVIVSHVGRRSGKHFATPIMAFPTPTGFVMALTYGPHTDWIRNVEAAGGCSLTYRRRAVRLTNPRIVAGSPDDYPMIPGWARKILHGHDVHDFLLLDRVPVAGSPDDGSVEDRPRAVVGQRVDGE